MGLALLSASSCGNYSNEDLEFAAALPDQSQLEIPVRSAIVGVDTAELYRLTRATAVVFNTMIDSVLGLVDLIRAFPPTTREPDRRVWGPVPSDDHPGWLFEMVMERKDTATFSYLIQFAPRTDPGAWIPLIDGTYTVSGGVRRGMGHLHVDTVALRGAGADTFGYLDDLTVDYTTNMFPISVDLEFHNRPNPFKPQDPTHGTYHYAVQSNGQGALAYDFTGDLIDGVNGLDTVEVTARWLGTGEGRADLQVIMGDATGAHEIQCWDDRFQAVYTYKPWPPIESTGTEANCAPIPTL